MRQNRQSDMRRRLLNARVLHSDTVKHAFRHLRSGAVALVNARVMRSGTASCALGTVRCAVGIVGCALGRRQVAGLIVMVSVRCIGPAWAAWFVGGSGPGFCRQA
ncbi:hypothetical protein GCM10022243_24330 [Saccharothrix violaceirubra]